ncbi:MAG: hypothetical protein WCS77_02765 [Elusimicrobiaceae bacterium]|jgi:hypothetical protein
MSEETLYVDCPVCGCRLEVLKKNGQVVKHWDKIDKDGGDIFSQALKKQAEEKKKLDDYFKAAPENLEKKKKELLDKFESEKKRIKDEKDFGKPLNPFDLD